MCTSNLIPLCSPKQAQLPTSLALGSFDGLHAGHRLVIESITRNAPGVPTVVSFWPHPREVLYGDLRLRLDLPSEKTSLLGPLGVKQLVLIPFDHALAGLSAETFFKEMLLGTLQARRIAIGANFRFGKNREGDAQTLKKLAQNAGIEISIQSILEDHQGRMSSSRIRSALGKGDLLEAKILMGRPYRFQGKVVKGRGIGKKIGWPTANLQVEGRKFLPGLGVYAAWTWINEDKKKFPTVMNLGPQPTIDPASPSAVEVHLLDQNINLLGSQLRIEPIKRLREQKRFENFSALSEQIGNDADLARSMLSNH